MTPNLLKILWFLIPLTALDAALIGWTAAEAPFRGFIAVLTALMLLCWLYLTVRLAGFRKRLRNFLRRLLAGDYEAGMRTRRRFADELCAFDDLCNQLADRLRAYDRLRADRVSIHARALDLILRHSVDLLITADVEKETFVFNPAAQKRLGIARNSFSFESVLKPKPNQTFAGLFHQAVDGRKVNTAGTCLVQLPGMDQPMRLHLLLLPLRDRDETVRFALITTDNQPTEMHEPA